MSFTDCGEWLVARRLKRGVGGGMPAMVGHWGREIVDYKILRDIILTFSPSCSCENGSLLFGHGRTRKRATSFFSGCRFIILPLFYWRRARIIA